MVHWLENLCEFTLDVPRLLMELPKDDWPGIMEFDQETLPRWPQSNVMKSILTSFV